MRILFSFLLVVPSLWCQPAAQDVILKVMKDEMARGKSLRVVGDPPYYIEYSLDDADLFSVSAAYGAVISERFNRIRQPRVRIRVGDPKLDNSNHIYSDSYRGSRYDPSQFVLDDNYDALRLGFWLATDRAYKQALEAFARKKASLKNINVTEQLGDFTSAPAVSIMLPVSRKPVDSAMWRSVVKNVSAVFGAYPEVLVSEASTNITQNTSYFTNTEGSEVRYLDNISFFRIRATGYAKDGSVIRDNMEFVGVEPGQLPPEAELKKAAAQVATNVQAMAQASILENYSGPVLFEGRAGAQVLAEVLARHFTYMRRPITDPDRPINIPTGELEGRLGARILPDFIDVVDDPTQKDWRGLPLLGSYPVDADGVVPKPLQMVEKGVLKTYFSGRQPLVGVEGSNGRARMPGGLGNNAPVASNVFIKTREPVPAADLKKRLLDLCKQRGKPFAIIVRKMDFPSTAAVEELRKIAGGVQGRPVSKPLLIYKITPDGKEELVRGVRFRGFNVRSLKDMLAASEELYPFHFVENGGPFAHMDAGGIVAGTSVIAPAVLVDDLELEKIPGELPTPPVVPPPPLTN